LIQSITHNTGNRKTIDNTNYNRTKNGLYKR